VAELTLVRMRNTSLLVIAGSMLAFALGAPAADVLIKTRNATLSATVVQPKQLSKLPFPTILIFDIYTRPAELLAQAQEFADRGYVGVVADVRGKRLSPDAVVPYEHDAEDTWAVIDWISKQSWSNGRVGMIGGSYSGFTAWAATKRKHPALKAIAVSAAAIPGQGLPMYNNVFLNANYGWAFYVTNNKLLDDTVYADRDRWQRQMRGWFASGRPYREFDAVDGTPNPWLQRWLRHPAFDRYWQRMVPYNGDFAHISIPVLTITGYYDDAQISALQYLKEHYKYRLRPEHYLVIGPYDHVGTHARNKPEVLRDYPIDAAARIDSQELKLAFMDYVLRGRHKPELLTDRINYEVMGANEWHHAARLSDMHGKPQRLYFTNEKGGRTYALKNAPPANNSFVMQEVDLADRNKLHNFHSYPSPIVQGPLQYVTEAVFESQPYEPATTVSGAFKGELTVSINKRDFDVGVTVFEAMDDGKLFHLGYSLNRASFVRNPAKRQLLTPGKIVRIPFETTLVSRRMNPKSRLFVLIDANKNPFAQVNYGTGKDVSDESVQDAGEPLKIRILAGSYVDVPLE